MARKETKTMKRKGFTLIELLVVIAIIGLLSTLAVVSLNSARAKARDARRLSDVKQLSTVLEMESTSNPAGKAVETCVLADAKVSTCDGPGDVDQFPNFSDPTGTDACSSASVAVCDYSISTALGAAAAKVDDYQICFYLEQASGSLLAGRNSIITGGIMTPGCL